MKIRHLVTVRVLTSIQSDSVLTKNKEQGPLGCCQAPQKLGPVTVLAELSWGPAKFPPKVLLLCEGREGVQTGRDSERMRPARFLRKFPVKMPLL